MPLVLFCLSALILLLGVLETRILAHSLGPDRSDLVVGVVLLGFGAGAVLQAIRAPQDDPGPTVRRCLLWTAAATVFGHGWFAVLADRLVFAIDFREFTQLREAIDVFHPQLTTFSVIGLLAFPYLCAGIATAALLGDPRGEIHRRCGLHLLGAAAGAAIGFLALGPLSAPQLVVGAAVAIALLAVPLVRHRATLLLITAGLGVPGLVYANQLLPFPPPNPAAAGLVAQIASQTGLEVEGAELVPDGPPVWDPVAQVQVYTQEHASTEAKAPRYLPSRWLAHGGGSLLIGRGADPVATAAVFERTRFGLGYFRAGDRPRVLILGPGGSPDLLAALHFDARHIDLVDANRGTRRILGRADLAAFLGSPLADSRVAVHCRNPRSFLTSSLGRYDLIQLPGTAPQTLLSRGDPVFEPNGLLTVEGVDACLSHLEETGLLSFRCGSEALRDRFAITAMQVLRERFDRGAPERHLMVVEQAGVSCVLVKPSPFTEADCAAMETWIAQSDHGGETFATGLLKFDHTTGVRVLVAECLSPKFSLNAAPRILFLPGERSTDLAWIRHAGSGGEDLAAHLASRSDDITPAVDSRPFFYQTLRPEQLLAEWWRGGRTTGTLRFAFRLLLGTLCLVVLAILVPLVSGAVRGIQGTAGCLPISLYLAVLGIGAALALVDLIRPFAILLAEPRIAFSVALGGSLAGAGIGSLLAHTLRDSPRTILVMAAPWAAVAIGGNHVFLDRLFATVADYDRISQSGAALGIALLLGLPIGMLIAAGLGALQRRAQPLAGWGLGLTWLFLVAGTTFALPAAALSGYPSLALVAGCAPLLGALVGYPVLRRGELPA